MNVSQIIKAAGGREAVATHTGLTPWALDKWGRIGIPEKHWASIIQLAAGAVTLEMIYSANQAAREAA